MIFRFATEQDCALILSFIRQLAAYEHMSNQVVATEELLREWIFEKRKAEVLCSSITFPRSWGVPESIWRICLSFQSIEIKAMGKDF